MKRARRGIVLGVLALLGGAVVSVLVVEGIGLLGGASEDFNAQMRFVDVGGRYIGSSDTTGMGWRYLRWGEIAEEDVALAQYMYDKHLTGFDGRLPRSYLHCDPPGSLPWWSRLWRPECWPQRHSMFALVPYEAVDELGVGWPLPAFSMNWERSLRNQYQGGRVLGVSSIGGLQALLWRPIPLGFALDTLIYAACIAGLGACVRLLIRARRRRRGVCAGCGYDLRGLAGGAACPECGTGAGVATGAA